MGKKITTKLFIFSTVFLITVVFLSSQVWAGTPSEIKMGEWLDNGIIFTSEEYISPTIEADFNFNMVGFSWQGKELLDIAIRFEKDDGWTTWYQPESQDFIAKEGWYFNTEPVLADQSKKYQYRILDTSELTGLKIIYIDSINNQKKSWNLIEWLFNKVSAATTIDVINRAGWGADESWRLNSQGKEEWPAEYQWPEKIIIHHTAGDTGGSNPAATIRAIYYWHSEVLGWADIGYNYLIDQSGNIYEGRAGGDGVVAAHAYRSASCAALRFGGAQNESSFNRGTVGISVLGDYQSGLTLNPAVKQALIDLIGVKSAEFGINPIGTSHFIDNTYANVLGHKDVDCTSCPGTNLYSQLGDIKISAKSIYEALGGSTKEIVRATYIKQSENPIEVQAGLEKTIWVDFRNDGNVAWHNYGTKTLAVVTDNNTSGFYLASWESPTVVARLATANVAPGEVGRFSFTIKGPTDQLEITESFKLSIGGEIITASAFDLNVQVGGLQFATVLEDQTIRPATFINATQDVTLKFDNRGTETWNRGEVKLNIYDLGDNISRFYHSSWPDNYGQINFIETSVGPGQTATFTFKFTSPNEPGLFLNVYRLTGNDNFVQPHDYSITRVDSTYQAELDSYTIPSALLTVWNVPAVVKYKNIGLAPWDRSMRLVIDDLGGAVSRFYDRSWSSYHVAAYMQESRVNPGEIGTFVFKFNAPDNRGLFLNTFDLQNGRVKVEGANYYLITRVD
ncbi:MAG: N-acetylmuramoyl-L-alanine amidase [bacterium]|nr:N-acetylmuramoyl-L-alanine amidase [bacterium]